MPSKSADCGHKTSGELTGQQLLTLHGPTLEVDIGFDPAHNPTAPTSPPNLARKGVAALVDTGAIMSFIDDDLAKVLGLSVVDRQSVSGSNGRHNVDMYLAHIYVPPLDFTIWGSFGGVNLAAGGQRHLVLIGRTFLRNMTMTYNGITGEVVISRP